MTGTLVAVLLAAACLVLVRPAPARWRGVPPPRYRRTAALSGHDRDGRDRRPRKPWRARALSATGPGLDLHEVPLFVHQLAGLLRAGRPPHLLWTDMELVYSDVRTAFASAALPVIATARRAAALGLSVPGALRDSGPQAAGFPGGGGSEVDRLWVDLAGCLEVAERSGAPLAAILEHYAGQLDARLDGVAARETALAGPRATVVLLAWLPAVGLVLGFALGINPLQVLTASPFGQLALAAGALLTVAGRLWSRRLVRRAGGAS